MSTRLSSLVFAIGFATTAGIAFSADQNKKAERKAETDAGIACSQECGVKHPKKGAKVDNAAYEDCMTACTKERRDARKAASQKK